MSNTFNASSTRGDDRLIHPLPWRAGLALLLLLVALIDLLYTAQPALLQRQAEQRHALLPWAGVIAEDAEQSIFASDNPNLLQTLSESTPPVFAENCGLAFVRYWDRDGKRAVTLLQRGGKVIATPNAEALPEMGTAAIVTKLARKAKDRAWTEPIANLQTMLESQGDLTKDLDYAIKSRAADDRFRVGLYNQQFEVSELAKAMRGDYPQLDDAITEMSTVLDALEHGGEALAVAIHASDAAETGISQVLEVYRTHVDATGALPEEVAGRGWLPVKGTRLLVPLYIPAAGEHLVQPAGYIETVFFDHLTDAAADIARRCWPATAAIGLAALLMISNLWKPRRKRRVRRDPSAARA